MRRRVLLIITMLMVAGLWPATTLFVDESSAAGQTVSISEDTVLGKITVETDTVKGVWHYKALPSESYNQSGGSLYELYYKPLDPETSLNLVAFKPSAYWGTTHSTSVWTGVGGIGSTNIYAASAPPPANQGNSFDDVTGDNNGGGNLQSRSATIDGNGNAVLTFVYNVRNQTSGTFWYRVSKEWTIKPDGTIDLDVGWRILTSGYFGEPSVRSKWSYEAGWDRLNKFGRGWMQPTDSTYMLSIDGIASETNNCWSNLNGFHPDWFALTGSDVAPTMVMASDYGSQGFRGSGSYQLGTELWDSTAQATLEQCSVYQNGALLGSHGVNWMAWWGGNPPVGQRYVWIPSGTNWHDKFSINLMEGSPGGGPDISQVTATGISRTGATITWETDIDADAVVEVRNNQGDWIHVGQNPTLSRNHQVAIAGMDPESLLLYRVKSTDTAGNLTISSHYTVQLEDTLPFALEVFAVDILWRDFADYQYRRLTVDFQMDNNGPANAGSVNITGVDSSNGAVNESSLPIALGDIDVGGAGLFTIVYRVPEGVSNFYTVISGDAIGPGNELVAFP